MLFMIKMYVNNVTSHPKEDNKQAEYRNSFWINKRFLFKYGPKSIAHVFILDIFIITEKSSDESSQKDKRISEDRPPLIRISGMGITDCHESVYTSDNNKFIIFWLWKKQKVYLFTSMLYKISIQK